MNLASLELLFLFLPRIGFYCWHQSLSLSLLIETAKNLYNEFIGLLGS